ncbi:hypothetical protein G7Z17_g6580 [Cylindrodendrum hubeiense]|uniref:Dolichyl-diphosphooligosaccharide--protein glycosyltransferase subunit 2 n=1 Tax=Cylindrodendrum hubeiense TaxID=595255 RepID=A0A9P5LF15_9HYPO|nr:hypothetical protein G7Z17_g6580 [Cylindrodendrum hubeiense]
MRFSIASSLLFLAGAAHATSTWGFADASVAVGSKKSNAVTQKFSTSEAAKNVVVLGHKDTLTVALTTKEGSSDKRPHQAFLILTESTGLEAPYPLTLKASGKGSVDITQKDLPIQLLLSDVPLKASIVLGSFGSSKASIVPAFDIEVQVDPNTPAPQYQAPIRYGKRATIQHTFREDAKSPPVFISLVFVLAVLATVPPLFIGWIFLGANVNDLPKALGTAPVSHAVFFGSIVAIEGAFFLYYSAWNLFQILPVVIVLSIVSFLSGTKALSEVQGRRLAGESQQAFPSAEETLKHAAYPSTVWGLEPHQHGKFAAAKDRGGPVNIAWSIHGSGPIKLVLIMGLAGVKTSWQRQTRYFGHDRGDEYSVLIVDNRGMGGSDKPLGRYSTSEMAKDIIEVLDHVGWTADREVNVAGISMGGMIAQEVAYAIPHRLQSLSLLCSSAHIENAKNLTESVSETLGFLIPKPMERAITDAARQLFTPEWLAAPDAEVLPVPGETPRCLPPSPEAGSQYQLFDSNFQRFQAQELTKRLDAAEFSRMGFLCQLVAAGWHNKSDEQLGAIADAVGRERILIIHGTRDNMITLPNGERLIRAMKPGVGLIVEGMGHSPPMERFQWLNSLLEERLAAWTKL